MSYCRWSSDDYQCDVYVYEDVRGGWTTHVAGNRPVIDRAALGPAVDLTADGDTVAAYMERHGRLMAMLDGCERVDIGLPHDGETFNDDTPGACADRLESLRALGYNVPPDAIEALREEQAAPDADAAA